MKGAWFFACLALVVMLAAGGASAQTKKKAPPKAKSQPVDELAKSRAELINATNAYKAELAKLIALLEAEARDKAAAVSKRQELLAAGIISKRDVENAQLELAQSQAKLERARAQVTEADHLIAEVRAEAQLVKLPPLPTGTYRATNAIIRYNGPVGFTLAVAPQVQGFFAARFGRALPVSAYGQSATHDRMGYDHRNALDVALHPDSAEGRALIDYLRAQGIPFIAFRNAVPGSATGAHIHVGRPSPRLGR